MDIRQFIAAIVASFFTLGFACAAIPENVIVYQGDSGPGKGKHIVFLASDHEYRAEETCPAIARILAKHHGFTCSVIFGVNNDGFIEPGSSKIPGTELLEKADLLFIFTRFLNPSPAQMKPIDDYLNRGGPVIGLRTATHAFKIPDGAYKKYDFRYQGSEYRLGFGRQVLGESWAGHYGPNHQSSTRLDIVPENQHHVVLTGCTNMHGMAGAYMANPEPNSVILAHAQPLTGMKPDSPVDTAKKAVPGLWVRTYKGADGTEGRVLTTTQGASEGIRNEGLRRCLINGVFWAVGLEDKIHPELAIDFVGPYTPKTFNFKGQSTGILPSSVAGFTSPILPAPSAKPVKAPAPSKKPVPFRFGADEVVAIVGNALPDRMQHDGYLEAALQSQLNGQKVRFRNLSMSGDRPDRFPRQKGCPSLVDYLRQVKADVIFAFFGYNESFDGVEKADAQRARLVQMIKTFHSAKPNGTSAPRVVLFSPIAFEETGDPNLPDGKEHNVRLVAFAKATREAAAETGAAYVNLFTPTRKMFAASDERLTINGAHLSKEGHRRLAEIIASRLFKRAVSLGPKQEVLRQAVKNKNWHWHNRYRATDGNDIWGSRSRLSFMNNQNNATVLQHELVMLDAMTANRDLAIWAAAQGKPHTIDDSNVPAPIPVISNVGGGSASSSAHKEGTVSYLSPEDSIKQMKVPDGYKLNVFASEEMFPDLANPVQMQVDSKGRIWVASWNSYPKWEPFTELKDSLMILEDTDQNGVADKHTIFAHVHNPAGFEFWNGGVIVTRGPDLLFLKDTDGDDRADERTVLLAGLGTSDTHHAANNLIYGPDGGIYWQSGIFLVHNHEHPWGPSLQTGASGMYRFDPRQHTISFLTAGSGPNPHGTSFDYWGYCYANCGTGGNSLQLRPKGKGFTMQLLLKRECRPVAGNVVVSSSHFPDDIQGDFALFNTIDFLGLKTYKLHKDGLENPAKKRGEVWGTPRQPLLASQDRNFRPTGGVFGDDGALYISDWHNVVIGHMQHNIRDPNRDKKHGRILRLSYPSRPLQKPVAIEGHPIPALLENLKHPVDGVRHRTRVELSERDSAKVLQAVAEWAKDFDPADETEAHHLLEALWLYQQHNARNESLLNTLLDSPVEHARIAAEMVKHFWFGVDAPRGGIVVTPKHKKKTVEIPEHLAGDDAERYRSGAEIYQREAHCSTCHQRDGQGLGKVYPPLAGTRWVLGNEDRLIKLTLHGLFGDIEVKGTTYSAATGTPPMTAFGSLLNDQEVADVLTYVRNSWGNQAPSVSAETVKRVRHATRERSIFWKPQELLDTHPITK